MQVIDNNDFLRIRVGIGRPDGDSDLTDWVLNPFSKEGKLVFKDSIDLTLKRKE